jgi:sulfate adenylyltransferase subunit 1
MSAKLAFRTAPEALLQSAPESESERLQINPTEATTHRALRFLTAGSVDDGKSTLIGRLLYDSRAILADQLDGLKARAHVSAQASAGPDFDLSLLTDGLQDEREQGITIDVAYRYFATPKRKFIIADAPGHEQYTRNMVTAAAGSDAAVVLVDITKLNTAVGSGLVELLPQTRRHALLAHLLRLPSIVFAVNKLDAVAHPGAAFEAVQRSLLAFATHAGLDVAAVVPVSALRGDNVTQPLKAPWYAGPSLLQVLESLPSGEQATAGPFSFPVQYVARQGNGTGMQTRVLWGRVAQGELQAGDQVQVFPSGETARVREVRHPNRSQPQQGHTQAGESAGVVLDRPLDVSRGDWLAARGYLHGTREFTATLAWLDTEPAVIGRKFLLRHGNQWVQARLATIEQRLDIESLQRHPSARLQVNDIGEVRFELQNPLPLLPFAQSRMGGALVLVDPSSHRTSAAVLVTAVQ